jgi:hypothetical protein
VDRESNTIGASIRNSPKKMDEFDYLKMNATFKFSRDYGVSVGRVVGTFVNLAMPLPPIGLPIRMGTKMFSADARALVELAKDAKRTGVSMDEAKILAG